jgi:tetratricopeptide (TPR) repeat protein
MSEAVVRFLTNLAGPAGTLLLLDDLQWASPDALDLLATLTRAAAEVPLRLIGAYRDTEVQPQDPLSELLADLSHAGVAARRLLGPLAPAEAAQLLDELLAEERDVATALRAQVLARAGGVPFFVVSCARALQQAGREDTQEDAVPWDVGQSVRQRLAALPEAARAVLGVAAVVGRVVPPALLTAVADRAEQDVLAALEAACRARLLVETGDEAYQFAHDVIREVVEAEVGLARRMQLHRRVAQALEQRPGEPPVELLAYHYERSGEQDKAALYLERAGARAQAQYAHAAAESYYRQALRHLEARGRAPEAAAVREQLSDVLFTVARYDAALAELEPALETYRAAGDVEGQARVLAQIGWMHAARDTPDEGLARLQSFLATLDPAEPSRGQAALYASLAWLFLWRGPYAECVTAAEQAAQLARAVGEDKILADVEVRRGTALWCMGRAEEGLRVLVDAVPLAEAAGDLNTLVRALHNIGRAHRDAGAFGRSQEYLQRALELAERAGIRGALLRTTSELGALHFSQGDWEAARGYLTRAIGLSRAVGWSQLSALPFLTLAQLHLAEGEWTQAGRDLDGCQMLAGGRADVRLWPEVQRLLAECDLLEGRPDAALARLLPLLECPSVKAWDSLLDRGKIYLLPVLARAHLARGEAVAAAEMVARGIQDARAHHNHLALVEALRVQALVRTRQERWAEAAQSLEEGVALARGMPYPYAEARLLQVDGEMQAQKGAPDLARERLEAALGIFHRLGARKDAERVAQAIGDLPARG